MRRLLCVMFCLCLRVPAYAQTPAASFDLTIYPATGPAQTRTVAEAAVLCAQPAPTGTTVNPNAWFWPDPARANQWCKVDDATRLTALADGTYEGTVTAISATGVKAPESSPRAPFTRARPVPPPAAVTGVRLSN